MGRWVGGWMGGSVRAWMDLDVLNNLKSHDQLNYSTFYKFVIIGLSN